jgi:hypothetical protein
MYVADVPTPKLGRQAQKKDALKNGGFYSKSLTTEALIFQRANR